MKTRIVILMALVMAVAVAGAIFATNRTAEAGGVQRIEVAVGEAIPEQTVTQPTCDGRTELSTLGGRDGLTLAHGTLSGTPVYNSSRKYPHGYYVGYIVRGYNAQGVRVCLDYDLVRVTITEPDDPVVLPTVPKAPDLHRTSGGLPPISLRWNAPNDGGSPILDYQVQRMRTAGDDLDDDLDNMNYVDLQDVGIPGVGKRVYTRTLTGSSFGAAPNTEYEWKVRARNSVGHGAWSNAITFTTTTNPRSPAVVTGPAPIQSPTPIPQPTPPDPAAVTCYVLHEHGDGSRFARTNCMTKNNADKLFDQWKNAYPGSPMEITSGVEFADAAPKSHKHKH